MALTMRWGALGALASQTAAAGAGGPGLGVRLASVPRLARAVLRGEYAGLAKSRLLLMVGALAYVISPLDLVPEAVFSLIGIGDDALVLAWLAATLSRETEAFLGWEARRFGG
jgi:uncharacterized membrane protein YkvA (DUF1232 family)